MRTHYQNLKVAENAPQEVIKAAYRALSQQYHPDRNPNDAEAVRIMQIINDSYEVLSDPERRQRHDETIRRARATASQPASTATPFVAPPPDASLAQWHTLEDDAVRGPFSLVQLATLQRQGRISLQTLVRRAGSAEWLPLRDMLHSMNMMPVARPQGRKAWSWPWSASGSAREQWRRWQPTLKAWSPAAVLGMAGLFILPGMLQKGRRLGPAASAAVVVAQPSTSTLADPLLAVASTPTAADTPGRMVADRVQSGSRLSELSPDSPTTAVPDTVASSSSPPARPRLTHPTITLPGEGPMQSYDEDPELVAALAHQLREGMGTGIQSAPPATGARESVNPQGKSGSGGQNNPPRGFIPRQEAPPAALPPSAGSSIASAPPASSSRMGQGPRPPYTRPALTPRGKPWPGRTGYLPGCPLLFDGSHCQVTVDNTRGGADVHAKLVDDRDVTARECIIYAGDKMLFDNLDPGSYHVRFRNLDTGAASRNDTFSLQKVPGKSGSSYTTMTLTLYTVPNGNAHITALDEDEF